MKIVPMLCGVSGSLQLLEPRKDIKSSSGINLPLFHCNALSVVPKICFCKTEQKPRHRSIFLVPTLKLNAAVYTRWQKMDGSQIQHHFISIVGKLGKLRGGILSFSISGLKFLLH